VLGTCACTYQVTFWLPSRHYAAIPASVPRTGRIRQGKEDARTRGEDERTRGEDERKKWETAGAVCEPYNMERRTLIPFLPYSAKSCPVPPSTDACSCDYPILTCLSSHNEPLKLSKYQTHFLSRCGAVSHRLRDIISMPSASAKYVTINKLRGSRRFFLLHCLSFSFTQRGKAQMVACLFHPPTGSKCDKLTPWTAFLCS